MEDGEIDDNHLLDVSVTFKVTKKPVIDESKVNQSTVMSGKDQQKLNNEATAEQNKKIRKRRSATSYQNLQKRPNFRWKYKNSVCSNIGSCMLRNDIREKNN